ncbi:MAG: hypothetical protein JWO38_1715 [Gemmataceae bacterium]|nr:hypothetical protein [Gemmataceae bacterium]
MRNIDPRSGFTLLELLAVLAVLLILAAVTIPSLSGLKGNAQQKAAADLVRARIADARGRAMEYGTAYRLAVSRDGTKLRIAPDVTEFGDLPADDPPTGASKVSEDKLDKASAGLGVDPEADPAADQSPDTGSGWVKIATFLPDGTCREDRVLIEVHETSFPPIRISLRGVTGGSRVLHETGQGRAKP